MQSLLSDVTFVDPVSNFSASLTFGGSLREATFFAFFTLVTLDSLFV